MTLKWIVLRETLSGGRCDGRPWPPAGEKIDVPDWEAEHAVAAGWAYYEDEPTAPEPASVPQPVRAPEPPPRWQDELGGSDLPERPPEKPAGGRIPRPGPGDDVPALITPADQVIPAGKVPERLADKTPEKPADKAPESAKTVTRGFTSEEDMPAPPQPSDPKQAWVDHAVTCGMGPEKASAMSKADLMSRFGERL